jgi:hypothetical protein
MVYDFDRQEFRPETINDLLRPGYTRNPSNGLDVPNLADLFALPTRPSVASPAEGDDV